MQRILITILPCLLLGFAAISGQSAAETWDGEVQVHGALRAMFHQGQTGAMVTLDAMLPDPDLFAVGALANLSGEITVIGGKAYLAYPDGAQETLTGKASGAKVAATLLVAAEVPAWHSVTTENSIAFEGLDEAIGKLAASAGMSLDARFPFLLEGEFEDLQWHVIDGSRLTDGGTSHLDHLAASTQTSLDRATAILIGFYSAADQGVFTHMGSKTHIHCVLDESLASGHVDHVTIPAGTTVKFPACGNRPTMIEAHFILFVADQEKSTTFYAEVFGVSPSLNVPGMTQFALPGGSTLGLMPSAGIKRLLGDSLPDPRNATKIPRAELYLLVDDPSALLRAALAAGATELSPVQPRGWGDAVGYCLDLDGHVLAFAKTLSDSN